MWILYKTKFKSGEEYHGVLRTCFPAKVSHLTPYAGGQVSATGLRTQQLGIT